MDPDRIQIDIKMESRIRISIRTLPIHNTKVVDADPHYFWKLDPDPHYNEKLDPDTHLSFADPQFYTTLPFTHWIKYS